MAFTERTLQEGDTFEADMERLLKIVTNVEQEFDENRMASNFKHQELLNQK